MSKKFLIFFLVVFFTLSLLWADFSFAQCTEAQTPTLVHPITNLPMEEMPEINFKFDRIDGADGYRAHVWQSTQTDGPEIGVEQPPPEQTEVTFVKILGFGQNLKWQVASILGGDECWSDFVYFSTPMPPCNYNDVCEPELGETPETCPDCAPDGNGDGGDGGGPPADLTPPIAAETLEELFTTIINFLFYLVMALVPLMIIWAAFLILTAAGKAEQINKGKTIILWTLVAAAIVLMAKGLPSVVKGILGG